MSDVKALVGSTDNLSVDQALELIGEKEVNSGLNITQQDVLLDKVQIGKRLRQILKKELGLLLELREVEVSLTIPLLDYGLDSITSTDLTNKLNHEFEITISPTIFFEFQDIDGFCEYLIENEYEAIAKKLSNTGFSLTKTEPVAAMHANAVQSPHSELSDDQTLVQTVEVVLDPKHESVESDRGRDLVSTKLEVNSNENSDRQHLLSIEEIWKQEEEVLSQKVASGNALIPVDESSITRMIVKDPEHGLDIEFVVAGEGEPILFLGGLLIESSIMWNFQIKALANEYRLIMPNMPGCSGSSLPSGNLSISDIIGSINRGLTALGVNKPIPVVGYSFGGVLAQQFVTQYADRIDRLLLICTTATNEGADDFNALMKEMASSKSFMEINRQWPMHNLAHYKDVISDFSLVDKLANIQQPVTVICGENDTYMPVRNSRFITSQLPDAKLMVVKGEGHLLGFTQPDMLNYHISTFLKKKTLVSGV